MSNASTKLQESQECRLVFVYAYGRDYRHIHLELIASILAWGFKKEVGANQGQQQRTFDNISVRQLRANAQMPAAKLLAYRSIL
ncbi:hypothetical protein GGH13_003762 [Coemansia sp. S155-1]|nr:hypothetical protein GGH13_003762 [Coemansia sp. S155-1]